MSPSAVILIAAVAGAIGSLGYSYHLGRTQGNKICEAEKIASQLQVAKEELWVEKNISDLQRKEIGEALDNLQRERQLNDELKDKLSALPLSKQPDCIPDSVLDSLRKFRAKARS